jgi:hypothetical protein
LFAKSNKRVLNHIAGSIWITQQMRGVAHQREFVFPKDFSQPYLVRLPLWRGTIVGWIALVIVLVHCQHKPNGCSSMHCKDDRAVEALENNGQFGCNFSAKRQRVNVGASAQTVRNNQF